MKNALWRMGAGAALVIVGLGIYAGVHQMNHEGDVVAHQQDAVGIAEFSRNLTEIGFAGDLASCVKLNKAQKEYVFSKTMTEYQSQSYLLAIASTPEEMECQDRARRFCESRYPGDCLATPGEVKGHRN